MAASTRLEEDFLGTRDISSDKYYGIHTQRAIENFCISRSTLSDHPGLIKGLVAVKKAAARTNHAYGLLSDEVAQAIDAACDTLLLHDHHLDQFPIDVFQGGAGTSTNMNVNEVLANVALEWLGHDKGDYARISPNDHVNCSQSTNDVYPTGFRIALYQQLIGLFAVMDRLRAALDAKAIEFRDVIKMGRTQLQDAVPMMLGQEFHAFQTALKEERRHIEYAASLLLEVNLGATAIGTGLNTPKGYATRVVGALAEITGLPCVPAEDLIEATSDCGAYISAHGALKRLAVKLSKICNDLRLLASGPRTGFHEINLPQMQAGSSIMPSKVNPVIPEVVNQVCFKVIGNDTCVTLAAEAGQLQLNVMEPVIAQSLFESIDLMNRAMSTLTERCITGITANAQVCLDYVLNSVGMVTYLNPYIGHHNGDLVGKECLLTGKSVREVVLERGLMNAQDVDQVLSLKNLSAPLCVI